MLRTPEDFKSAPVTQAVLSAERSYVIQKNDLLKLEVYSNKGERIVDPNPALSRPTEGSSDTKHPEITYLVELNGTVKFPVVGEVKLDGLTLRQAEEILQVEFEKFFNGSFVVLKFENKRVVMLGAVGGQVIPLVNPNLTLVEVLAMAKGLPNDSKVQNIKIIRGDQLFVVDLSTVAGFQAGNMLIEAGDIIYVEPVRHPVAEGLRDYASLASLFISALSLIIVIRSIN